MLCLLCQWLVARRLDDGGEPPRWLHRHLAHCGGCRAQYDRHLQLITRLTQDSDRGRIETPRFLHARIMANLDSGCAAANDLRASRFWKLAATAAIAGVLLFVLFREPRSRQDSTPPVAELAALADLPLHHAALALGTRLDAPLEGELRLVLDDARTALSALSRSFLPAEYAEPRR